MNKFKITVIILWSALFFLLGFISHCEKVCPDINQKTLDPIKDLIDQKQEKIKESVEATKVIEKNVSKLREQNEKISADLIYIQSGTDSALIIRTHDSLIKIQKLEIRTLDHVIRLQERTIDLYEMKDELQSAVIESQELEILDLKSIISEKEKKQKRQVRAATIVGSIWFLVTTASLITK